MRGISILRSFYFRVFSAAFLNWCLLKLQRLLTYYYYYYYYHHLLCNCCSLAVCIAVVVLCVLLSYVYLLYCVGIAVFVLAAGLLARSQYSVVPATGYFDTGFSRFPCVYKQMLRWFPTFQIATTCFSCSPPDLNLVVTNFIFCIHVKWPLPPGDNPIAVYYYYYYYYYHYYF